MAGLADIFKNESSRRPMMRLARRALVHKGLVVASILGSLVFAVLSVGQLASFIPFLNTLFSQSGAQSDLYAMAGHLGPYEQPFREFVDRHILPNKIQALVVFSAVLCVLVVLKGMARFVVDYTVGLITNNTVLGLQKELYERVLEQEYAFFQHTGVAQLLSRFTNDIDAIYKGIRTFSGKMIREPIAVLGFFLFCLFMDWKLTLCALVVLPAIAYGVAWIGSYARKRARKMLQVKENVQSVMKESFEGIRIVKIFGAEHMEKERFGRENERVMEQNLKVIRASAALSPFLELLAFVGVSIVVVIGSREVLGGTKDPGEFITFFGALMMMVDPFRKLANVNARLQDCVAGAVRVFEIIDRKPLIVDRPGAKPLPPLHNTLEFKEVDFSYDGERGVLRKVSFCLKRGEVLAIVGLSGSGKTTLVNLVARFYEPVGGRIEIDGNDIANATLASLRGQMAMVTQDTLLFNDTVARNIAYGAGSIDMARVEKAAHTANATEFIHDLPKGYQTGIGEQGVFLSGGQRQRLAIARAIYKDPSLLILDEATSSLDSQNEAVVQKVLNEFMKGRTTIIIAHRLSTIEKADRILVLNKGEVEAIGPHAQLIETSGTYRRLCQQQFKLQNQDA